MRRIDLEALVEYYNNSKGWGRKMLNHPAIRALGRLLNKKVKSYWSEDYLPSELDDYDVVKCFLDNPTQAGHESHKVFLEILGIVTVAPNKETTAKIFAALYDKSELPGKNLLPRKTFEYFQRRGQISDSAWALQIFRLSGIGEDQTGIHYFNKHDNYETLEYPIISHRNPRELAQGLYQLYSKGLLNSACRQNLELVVNCRMPQRMADHLEKLSKATLADNFPISEVKKAIANLVKIDLDTDANCVALLGHPQLKDICWLIKTTSAAQSLDQTILDFFFSHLDSDGIANIKKAVSELKDIGSRYRGRTYLTKTNMAACAESGKPYMYAQVLRRFYSHVSYGRGFGPEKIIPTSYVKACMTSKQPVHVAMAICTLANGNVPIDEYLDYLSKSSHPKAAADAMNILHREGLMNDLKNVEAYLKCPGYLSTTRVRGMLHKADIVNTPAIESTLTVALQNKSQANHLYQATIKLRDCHILSSDRFRFIASHPELPTLGKILKRLKEAYILNKDTFDALCNPANKWLSSDEAEKTVWRKIPNDRLTPKGFNQLLQALANVDPENRAKAVDDFINQTDKTKKVSVQGPGRNSVLANRNAAGSEGANDRQQAAQPHTQDGNASELASDYKM